MESAWQWRAGATPARQLPTQVENLTLAATGRHYPEFDVHSGGRENRKATFPNFRRECFLEVTAGIAAASGRPLRDGAVRPEREGRGSRLRWRETSRTRRASAPQRVLAAGKRRGIRGGLQRCSVRIRRDSPPAATRMQGLFGNISCSVSTVLPCDGRFCRNLLRLCSGSVTPMPHSGGRDVRGQDPSRQRCLAANPASGRSRAKPDSPQARPDAGELRGLLLVSVSVYPCQAMTASSGNNPGMTQRRNALSGLRATASMAVFFGRFLFPACATWPWGHCTIMLLG